MERTKGKLKVLPYTRRDRDNVCWIGKDNKTSTPICRCFGTNTKLGRKRTEATTKHFVRCWNAFEAGGSHSKLLEALKKDPAPNVFAQFADFTEDCMTKPSMAVYRSHFTGLSTFLRSCQDRAEKALQAIAQVEADK